MRYISVIIPLLLLFAAVSNAVAADNLTRLERSGIASAKKKAPSATQSMLPAILELEENASLDSLISKGVVIFHTRENLALASVPLSIADEELLDGVKQICAARQASVNLDRAKATTGINAIHSGGVPGLADYMGRNVVVGICDVGFDPNHPAFKDSRSGKTRVNHIVTYRETEGKRTVVTPDQYQEWQTDTTQTFHATHVAGILAGSCSDHSYHGVAPEANIVITLSELFDVGILSGAEDIIKHAKETGMPAVINMSVGSYLGPHDGSTLFNRYLSLLGKDAIICLASGNEGNRNNSLQHTFKADGEDLFVINGTDWIHYDIDGYADIWSDSINPLDITVGVISSDERKVVYRSFRLEFNENGIAGLTTQPNLIADNPFLVYDKELASYFEGTILAAADIDPYNNRYNITVKVSTHCPHTSTQGPWALYHPALIIGGKAGQTFRAFADSQNLLFSYIPGHIMPTTEMSASNLACGDNILCVGMYTTRSEVTTLNGETTSFPNYVDNTVNHASGYATLDNGTILPHVVAPGAMIVSAISTPYLDANPERIPKMIDTTIHNGNTYYWGYEGGTSMATPFTAGTIALWLEAEPKLSINQIQNILRHTNNTDVADPDNPRHGQGWIQPIDGLKFVLENYAGLSSVQSTKSPVIINGTNISVISQDALPAHVTVYDSTGRLVAYSTIDTTDSTRIPGLTQSGLYIVKVSPAANYSQTIKKLIVTNP